MATASDHVPCPSARTARRARRPVLVGAAVVAGALGGTGLATAPALASAGSAPPTVHVLVRGYDEPRAMAVAGGDLFVGNQTNSVTELNAASGALVRMISAPADEIIFPLAMATLGDDVFVMEGGSPLGNGGRVTELTAPPGALVRVLSGPPTWFGPSALTVAGDDLVVASRTNLSRGWVGQTVTKFNAVTGAPVWEVPVRKIGDPDAVAVAGGDVFVADGYGDTVTELNASGAELRVLSGPAYQFKAPSALAVAGGDVWVTDDSEEATASGSASSAPDRLTELNASTGALVRVLAGPAYQFKFPDAMAVAGDDLFVVNEDGNSVTELNASTGALVRVFSGPAYKFNVPDALAVAGSNLFVANYKGNSVTEITNVGPPSATGV